MSNDWQWNNADWQQPSEPNSLDRGLGSYPTQSSSGSGDQADGWEPVPPPPPPPLSSYYSQSDSGRSDFSQSSNPFGTPPGGSYPFSAPGGSFPYGPPAVRSRPWFLVPLIIFLVVCAGGVGASVYVYNAFISKGVSVSGFPNTGPSGTAGPVTISVSAQPTIVIDRNAGAVQVQGVADSKQVVIKPIDTSSPLSDGQILYTKNSDGMITFDLSNIETVTVLLMVPTVSNLNITTNGDDISVTGVQGVQTFSSNGGSLHVSQDTLMGTSTVETNGGSITFDGALDPQSQDHFSTNPDSITITLPATASFHVDITNNGGVIQSDFPQVVISSDEAHGDVGQPPLAQLEIDSNGGTIQLKKAA